MRKLLWVLLLLGLGYVAGELRVHQMLLSEDTQSHPLAAVAQMQAESSFVQRLNSAFAKPTKRPAPQPPSQVVKPLPKTLTPEQLKAREREQRRQQIARLFSPDEGAVTTASGLVYRKLLVNEDGMRPSASGVVRVVLMSWTDSGEVLEMTPRGSSTILRLHDLVPGLREGLLLMRTGEAARLWIPTKLAYGDAPTQPGAPAGPLRVDVVLGEVLK